MSVKYNIVQGTLEIESGTPWSIGGNSGTNSSTQFIGTTDSQGLRVRTNNIDAAFIDTNQSFYLMSSSSAHIAWNNPGGGNIGVTSSTGNGTQDFRPNNFFLKGAVLAGNIFAANPPYGLNVVAASGAFMSGNLTSTATLTWTTAFFNSVNLGFMGFAKEGSFANCPGFVNLDASVSDYNIYFSICKRAAPRVDLLKFGSDGTLNLLGSSGANLLWTTDGSGDIGASGATRPNNIYVKTNVRIGGNLGVGNSASATVPGTVTKKIEVFDDAGVSLGFLAVYDAIV